MEWSWDFAHQAHRSFWRVCYLSWATDNVWHASGLSFNLFCMAFLGIRELWSAVDQGMSEKCIPRTWWKQWVDSGDEKWQRKQNCLQHCPRESFREQVKPVAEDRHHSITNKSKHDALPLHMVVPLLKETCEKEWQHNDICIWEKYEQGDVDGFVAGMWARHVSDNSWQGYPPYIWSVFSAVTQIDLLT